MKQGGGAHLTKPGWSKPHTHSNPTNLVLFRHKITLYIFNQGGSYYCRWGSNGSRGLSPPSPPHFNHWLQNVELSAILHPCRRYHTTAKCILFFVQSFRHIFRLFCFLSVLSDHHVMILYLSEHTTNFSPSVGASF